MNINPVDGNIVGWGNDFWAGKHEYGAFEHRFARDYKSPAAYLLKGDELMIQSVAYPAGHPSPGRRHGLVHRWWFCCMVCKSSS